MATYYTILEDGVPKGVYADQVTTDAPPVKMAVYVDRPTHRRIKALAALRGQSMSEMVVQIVTDELDRTEEG